MTILLMIIVGCLAGTLCGTSVAARYDINRLYGRVQRLEKMLDAHGIYPE